MKRFMSCTDSIFPAYLHSPFPSRIHSTLKMGTAPPSETLVSCHVTTEDTDLNAHILEPILTLLRSH